MFFFVIKSKSVHDESVILRVQIAAKSSSVNLLLLILRSKLARCEFEVRQSTFKVRPMSVLNSFQGFNFVLLSFSFFRS